MLALPCIRVVLSIIAMITMIWSPSSLGNWSEWQSITDEDIANYVREYLAKNKTSEKKGVESTKKYPFSGAISASDIKLSEVLASVPVPIPQGCAELIMKQIEPVGITLETQAHACPNNKLAFAHLYGESLENEDWVLLVEGRPADTQSFYSGDFVSQSNLDHWKGIGGWECPSQSMYLTLQESMPVIVNSKSVQEIKEKAWAMYSVVFSTMPPIMLVNLLDLLPEFLRELEFTKSLKKIAEVRIQNMRINPFTDDRHKNQTHEVFAQAEKMEIQAVSMQLITALRNHLADFMKIEMPEIALENLGRLAQLIPNLREDFWGIYKVQSVNVSYRNRCAVKTVFDRLCTSLKNGESANIKLSIGAGHDAGIKALLREAFASINESRRAQSLDEIHPQSVDNYTKYIDMGIDDRIKDANILRRKLKGLKLV